LLPVVFKYRLRDVKTAAGLASRPMLPAAEARDPSMLESRRLPTGSSLIWCMTGPGSLPK
jgi:hypothetical protein